MKVIVRSTIIMCALLVVSFNAHAIKNCARGGPTLDARIQPYSALPAVNGQHVTVDDIDDLRIEVMTASIGAYRTANGISKLPVGSTFKMIYKDGSRECGAVISITGSYQGDPIPDTARRPGDVITVEDTTIYINKYQFQRPAGSQQAWFNVCYDYYTNGVLTDTECHIEPF